MEKRLVCTPEICIGCHSCRLACAVEHTAGKNLLRSLYEDEKPVPRLDLEVTQEGIDIRYCRQCEDAPCLRACKIGAITRPEPEGPVLLDTEKCIGCRACLKVCPYGAIMKSGRGKTYVKCDLCRDRLSEGKPPACARACPTGAIRFVVAEKPHPVLEEEK